MNTLRFLLVAGFLMIQSDNAWAQAGWFRTAKSGPWSNAETWEGGEDTYRGGSGPLGTQWAKTTDPLYQAWIDAGGLKTRFVQAGDPAHSVYRPPMKTGTRASLGTLAARAAGTTAFVRAKCGRRKRIPIRIQR